MFRSNKLAIHSRTRFTLIALLLVLCQVLPAQEEPRPHPKQIEFFESRIRPVLIKHCYECHSVESTKRQGGLSLDHREAMLTGGDSGPSVVPGSLDKSLLLSALKYQDFEMPPEGQLPDQVIRDFEKWIAEGAVDPRQKPGESEAPPTVDWEKAKQSWAFRVPTRQSLPQIKNRFWPANRIDYFVLARMEVQQLEPAAAASAHELTRRLSFDLVGLPPDPNSSLSSDPNVQPMIDKLLASPAFGEKWSRFWLDLARYAEDQAHIVGNNQSLFYPNAYLYREWVIDAFNRDLSYDQFVQNQLAVDLIAKQENREASDRELVALGFLGLGPKYYRRNSPAVMADEWEDRIDVVSRGLLGLTVACARCHDHKYDPISTEDYYALAGVFASTQMYNKPLEPKDDQGAASDSSNKKKPPKKNTPASSLHILRDRKVRNLNVFVRGDPQSKGAVVNRRFLTVLDPDQKQFGPSTSGRLELAKAITQPSNPLFAKVIVNRVWGLLIGKPLVSTPSNFGSLGDRPTHPQLLDDLAFRFMKHDWSMKWLVREIVSSRTYQQTSLASAGQVNRDPANRWLSRMNRKRLEIEQWRDAVLVTTGRLQNELGGRSMDPSDSRQRRRTIYSKVSRFQLDPMLALFDFPDPNAHAAKRSQTISPLQKMFALNSPFLLNQSEELLRLLQTDSIQSRQKKSPGELGLATSNSTESGFVLAAYQRTLQRQPSATELKFATEFLTLDLPLPEDGESHQAARNDRRMAFLQTLLISNEFNFID